MSDYRNLLPDDIDKRITDFLDFHKDMGIEDLMVEILNRFLHPVMRISMDEIARSIKDMFSGYCTSCNEIDLNYIIPSLFTYICKRGLIDPDTISEAIRKQEYVKVIRTYNLDVGTCVWDVYYLDKFGQHGCFSAFARNRGHIIEQFKSCVNRNIIKVSRGEISFKCYPHNECSSYLKYY